MQEREKKRLYSTEDAARYLSLSSAQVYRLAVSGKLKSIREGRRSSTAMNSTAGLRLGLSRGNIERYGKTTYTRVRFAVPGGANLVHPVLRSWAEDFGEQPFYGPPAGKKLAQRAVGDIVSGRDVPPNKATVADLCDLVLADYRLRKRRDSQHVEWRYRAHVEPALGIFLASRLTAAQIRAYVEDRRKADASDATINRELAIVRRAFTLAMREDPPLIRRAPYIPKLEEDNARQGFLEPEQYERLLEELPAPLKALFVCGYHTGARKGELRKVRLEQVDFDAALIAYPQGRRKGRDRAPCRFTAIWNDG